jgi:Crossover junction endodeoxyribonuclease RuvC
MQQMVGMQLGLRVCPEPADAADALAVALCHAHSTAAQIRMMESTRDMGNGAGNGANAIGGPATGSARTIRQPASKPGRVSRAAAI